MTRRHLPRCARWMRLLPLVLALGAGPARALEEQELKAAIVFNILLFVEWPKESIGDTLALCLERRTAGGSFLALQGRTVGPQRIDVRELPAEPEWRGCQVVYLGESLAGRLGPARSLPGVLLISDDVANPSSAAAVVLRHNGARLAFDINLQAARQAQLRLSSKLLRLAQQVKE